MDETKLIIPSIVTEVVIIVTNITSSICGKYDESQNVEAIPVNKHMPIKITIQYTMKRFVVISNELRLYDGFELLIIILLSLP